MDKFLKKLTNELRKYNRNYSGSLSLLQRTAVPVSISIMSHLSELKLKRNFVFTGKCDTKLAKYVR